MTKLVHNAPSVAGRTGLSSYATAIEFNHPKNLWRLHRAEGRAFSGDEAKVQSVVNAMQFFVPHEIKEDRDPWRIVTGSVSIVTAVITTALLIDRL